MELFIRKEIPSKLIAVEIALGKKSILEKFIDNLDEPKLVELVKKNIPNIELAIKLAGSNRKLKEKVEREVLTELLNKRKRTLNEDQEVISLLEKIGQYKRILKMINEKKFKSLLQHNPIWLEKKNSRLICQKMNMTDACK